MENKEEQVESSLEYVEPEWMKRNKFVYYFNSLAFSAMFVPIVFLIWESVDLSFNQMLLTQGIFALSILIFEIPSGAIADVLGRKKTLLVSHLTTTISIFLFSIAYTFEAFLVSEIIWGFAIAMYSGTDRALMFESLEQEGQKEQFSQIVGKGQTLMFLSSAAFTVLGGFLGPALMLRLPIYLATVGAASKTVMTFLVTEPDAIRAESPKQALTSAFTTIKNSWVLQVLIIVFLAGGVPMRIAYWAYQPLILDSGYDARVLGLLLASASVVAAIGSRMSHRVEQKMNVYVIIGTLLAVDFMHLALLIIIRNPAIILVIYMASIAGGLRGPIFSNLMNQQVSSHERATVISIMSAIISCTYMLTTFAIDLVNLSMVNLMISLTIFEFLLIAAYLAYVSQSFARSKATETEAITG